MPDFSTSLDRRRRLAVVFLGLAIAAGCVAIVSGVFELRLLNRIVAGEVVSDSEAKASDTRQALVAVVQFAILLGAVVCFIRWFHLAYRNVDRLAPGVRRWKTGWAIGGWFVPVLGLWRPKQVFNDVWRSGAPGGVDDAPSSLATLWWAAFVISGWVGNVALRAAFSGDEPEDLRDSTIAYLVSDGVDLVAAVLAILVVNATSRRLQLREREAAQAEPATLDWSTPERPDGLPAPAA